MKKREQGAAVIVAVLIVTLAASTAAFAVWQQSLWVRQLENITDRAKADQLAISAIDVARDVLKKDNAGVDDLGEAWATEITLPADNATVGGAIVDQQGRFNLNNLASQNGEVSAPHLQAFSKLLDNLNLQPSNEIAAAVADWIKQDPSGLVDLHYLSLDPPYRAAQRPLLDVGELARIKGFDENVVRALLPYVSALPSSTPTPLNVNTASAEVISAVLPNLSLSDAKRLVEQRDSKPFKTAQEFKDKLSANTTCLGQDNCYGVRSNFFTATVRVRSGRVEAGYAALLKRNTGQWPDILWRKEAAD